MLRKYPLLEISLRNGLIAGFLGMILFLGLYFMGRHPFFIPVFLDFRILLFSVFLFFSIKEYRDYTQQGNLSFWQGMVLSLVLTIVFAIIGLIGIWVFSIWRPEFVSSYVSMKLEQARLLPKETIDQIGQANFEAILKALPSTRGMDLAFVYFWTSFVISFFLSIIISVILRNQPKNP